MFFSNLVFLYRRWFEVRATFLFQHGTLKRCCARWLRLPYSHPADMAIVVVGTISGEGMDRPSLRSHQNASSKECTHNRRKPQDKVPRMNRTLCSVRSGLHAHDNWSADINTNTVSQQERCQVTPNCAFFTFNLTTRECFLSPLHASWTPAAGYEAGPRVCGEKNDSKLLMSGQ